MNDPQQEVFSRLLVDLKATGHAVYDGTLPPEGTPYPFVYIGDCQQTDNETKNAVIGNVHLTVHVWHSNPKQRGTVSKMLLDIKTACRRIDHTTNFAWMVTNITGRILTDSTTKQPLLHGVVEVEWKFS